jgi:hypothetical protein
MYGNNSTRVPQCRRNLGRLPNTSHHGRHVPCQIDQRLFGKKIFFVTFSTIDLVTMPFGAPPEPAEKDEQHGHA